jgi:hypothetical protein
MRRIVLVLSAVALVAAITAFSSVGAVAQEGPVCTTKVPEETMGIGTITCVETVVRSEEVRTSTTEDCVIDNPGRGDRGRPGTQEGDLVRTDEVTYQITTTTYYRGDPANGNEANVDPNPSVVEEELSRVVGEETFEPTETCQPMHGPAQPS